MVIAFVALRWITPQALPAPALSVQEQTSPTIAPPSPTPAWLMHTSPKIPSLHISGYTLSYPHDWNMTYTNDGGISETRLSQNGYAIVIYQAPMGGAKCVFKGENPPKYMDLLPPFEDIREKTYVQIDSPSISFRRYASTNHDGKPIFSFCNSNTSRTLWGSIETIGTVRYELLEKADDAILSQMDAILSTLKLNP
jgi:hypothetical protein